MTHLVTDSLDETQHVGGMLAETLINLGAQLFTSKDHFQIHLYGDLGTGKTSLVRGFLMHAGIEQAIKSPTFSRVETYETPSLNVCHFDLYRCASDDEFFELGLADYFQGNAICWIEWPERVSHNLLHADIEVHMTRKSELERDILLIPKTDSGHSVLKAFMIKPRQL